jgi:hypothetical protein
MATHVNLEIILRDYLVDILRGRQAIRSLGANAASAAPTLPLVVA